MREYEDLEPASEREWDNICRWQIETARQQTYDQWKRFNESQPYGDKVTLSEFVDILRDAEG